MLSECFQFYSFFTFLAGWRMNVQYVYLGKRPLSIVVLVHDVLSQDSIYFEFVVQRDVHVEEAVQQIYR